MTDASVVLRPRTLRGQRVVNLLVGGLLRTPGLAGVLGRRLVLLYVVGSKTGRTYRVPVAYQADGDDLLIGTSFPWGRNLRTGHTLTIALRGRTRTASVSVSTGEADVIREYAVMARRNPTFARFNGIRLGDDGEPDADDLHAAWRGGARVIRLTPVSSMAGAER